MHKDIQVTIHQQVGMRYTGTFKGMDPSTPSFLMLDMELRIRRFPRNGITKMIRSDGVDVTDLLYPEKAQQVKP